MSPARILVIDDDSVFAAVLARSIERHGLTAHAVADGAAALAALDAFQPSHAVLDLMLGEEDGLSLLEPLLQRRPRLKVLLLTGYASIATAVEAIKRGAHDYLAKPVDTAAVLAALGLTDRPERSEAAHPLGLNRLQWEHIQRVLRDHDGNISATARALGMHRRTLQRKLGKRAPRPR
jgi:two-component system response regulator RegA